MDMNHRSKVLELVEWMEDADVDAAVIDDPDTVFYLSGFWGYLGMEFGRPTLLVVQRSGRCALITPAMEVEMAGKMTWIDDIREWTDGIGGEWMAPLNDLIGSDSVRCLGVESTKIHSMVLDYLKRRFLKARLANISPILSNIRMIKTPSEVALLRRAGQVVIAMCDAAVTALGVGVAEYEVALVAISAGTRKAAEFLKNEGVETLFSPMVHDLQIMQSGPDLAMVHRRPTTRLIQTGDPVYLCFCPFTHYRRLKLGFDRQFFVGSVSEEHARIYEIALKAQSAALSMIRAGVRAEKVHAAALEVYQAAGFGMCYRTGRGIGYSFLESPEFKSGDQTILKSGMTFAVDGGITVPGQFGARVGDSVVVTDEGFEYLTPFPKALRIL